MPAGAYLTSIAAILKYVYEPRLQNAIDTGTPYFAQLQKRARKLSAEGLGFVIPIRSGLNQAVGAGDETGDLMDYGRQRYKTANVSRTFQYGRVAIYEATLKVAQAGVGAVATALNEEMSGLQESLRLDINRQLFGLGTAQLCLVNGAVTDAKTVNCDNGMTLLDGTTRRIYVDQRLDFWNGGTLQASDIQVASVPSTTQFTVTQDINVAENALVCRHGAKNAAGTVLETAGLQQICAATGALQGLNPATGGEEFWKSVHETTVGTLSEIKLIKFIQDIKSKMQRAPKLGVTTNGVMRAMFDMLDESVRREPVNLKAGYKAISLVVDGDEVAFMTDPDCPDGNLFALNLEFMEWSRLANFEFMGQDGNILHRIENKPGYGATLFCFGNQATTSRQDQGRMSGITEPST